jgi:ubiquinone/menaquinone biosynthesis C-methylase UbiE
VLEVGAGTGLSFPFYGPGVELVATEPDPHMLRRGRRHAAALGLAVDVRDAPAEALPFPNASVDAVVCTLVLCTVADPARALAEIRRVLAPVRAPKVNAVAERLLGPLRRECLDRWIVVNEAHLRAVLTEFAQYCNREWPHRTLALQTPEPYDRPRAGPIRARPVLGGLHHVYERAA